MTNYIKVKEEGKMGFLTFLNKFANGMENVLEKECDSYIDRRDKLSAKTRKEVNQRLDDKTDEVRKKYGADSVKYQKKIEEKRKEYNTKLDEYNRETDELKRKRKW